MDITYNFNKITSITKNNNTTYYDFNASGIRTRKRTSNKIYEFITINDELLSELVYNINNILLYRLDYMYDSSGSIYGFSYTVDNDTTNYYYVKNLNGDIVSIVDEYGSNVAYYEYDACGNIIKSWSDNNYILDINSFTYRSYYYDKESNLYYLVNRYYNPKTSSFIELDDTSYLDFTDYNTFNLHEDAFIQNVVISNFFSTCLVSLVDLSILAVNELKNEVANNIVFMNNKIINSKTTSFGKYIINYEEIITNQLNKTNGSYSFFNFGSTNSFGIGTNLGDFESSIFANDNHCIGTCFRIYGFVFSFSGNINKISFSYGICIGNISKEHVITIDNILNDAMVVCVTAAVCNGLYFAAGKILNNNNGGLFGLNQNLKYA